MPLQPGKKGIGPNIAKEEAAGKKKSQAIAIALDEARRTGAKIPKPEKKAHGGHKIRMVREY